jgi:hypothetical protein
MASEDNRRLQLLRDGHRQFLPLHLLKVLLDGPEGLAGGLIDRVGGNSRAILAATEWSLEKLPEGFGERGGASLSFHGERQSRFAQGNHARCELWHLCRRPPRPILLSRLPYTKVS